ncbi:MAG: ATP-dependent endonuclease [Bacteroidetes bacterium]|uniref:ATP-dependent endonuclease n=1 Tax=Bacteroidota TaxID=976 RepID=UPI0008378664|nr:MULTISPECIES: ATP-dependent endonuclease [Bacteroidota]MBS1730097.1 ATP-dependent endonuclease [Bacteroidota bacterium]HOZ97559.1 ATP-dependent endonuclease [Niabella sp.]MCT4198094.1 ATP-dependent endonuclease [Elizabethkingia anophelis]MCT4226664.1 ATP-dependent endonuclease [Elizabethkingia anophelis]MCT4308257.1 ATP-dependent endonuclease [Elizabethkingia anophelis]
MKIKKIEVENFRLLKTFSIDLENELSLVIGKNNTGKTSILSVLDKFINEKSKFSYDDFNIDFKNELEGLIKSADIPDEFLPKGIKLKIYIEYNDTDDLSNVSRVLMDLDPDNNNIVLGFEYTVIYDDFFKIKADYAVFEASEKAKNVKKKEYKPRELKDFLKQNLEAYFKIHKFSFEYDTATNKITETKPIDLISENINLKDIISFKYISARRDVTNKEKENTLSKQTSSLYKKKEDSSDKTQATEDFKDQLSETDSTLSDIYKDLFKDVIKKVQDFGGVKLNDTDIAIISTLQHRELLEGNTTVVYTHDDHKLPEHYNGLGYMNLISMIFEIEILVQDFKKDKDKKPADINLLIIEEPEAHTHPQMQYVFIKNIKKLLGEGIKRDDGINRPLQYIITTHSSHIVADSDFDDIKYLKAITKNDVTAKNLKDLRAQYDADPKQYQFLKQYLTISRAEIFFADKAILIEGDTERILIPTFMRKVDLEEAARLKAAGNDDTFLPLLSQNISTIEVGAYSQIFEKFIDFLGIRSLILTDIDAIKVTGQNAKGQDEWGACPVNEGTKTSNSAINHFLSAVTWNNLKALPVGDRTIVIGSSTICICYQQEENTYHARSFEDAFIHLNRAFVKENKDTFQGIKNASDFDDDAKSPYDLADKCVKKKTHFALDILYHSDEKFSNWNIPAYIKNGLLWLKED